MKNRWIRILALLMVLCFVLPAAAAGKKREVFKASSVKVGGYVRFGYYEQDNKTENGREPIEWLVLAVKKDQALLISRYGLDCQPYNQPGWEPVTWETCSLRTWLNDTFYKEAFSGTERKAIVKKTVSNKDSQGNSGWGFSGGKNTKDKVFLLSFAEANRYFGLQDDQQKDTQRRKPRAAPTAYARAQGAEVFVRGDRLYSETQTAQGLSASWWWLRSPGNSRYNAAAVTPQGMLTGIGTNISNMVRPALWVDLNAEIFQ